MYTYNYLYVSHIEAGYEAAYGSVVLYAATLALLQLSPVLLLRLFQLHYITVLKENHFFLVLAM